LDGTTAGFVGTALGLVVAAAAVSAVEGHPAWRGVPASNLALTALLALAAGAVTTAARLVPLVRAGRRGALSVERRQVPGPWTPAWRRARLDLVLLGIGVAILAANILAGGLKPTPVPGQAVALSFYVLLAPLALWLGASLLVTRVLLGILGRSSRPDEDRQLSSWAGTAVRWLGRRPARTATAFIMAVLAVTFGTEVLTFVATYRSARAEDARAAFGADLRLTPAADYARTPPPLGPDVVATSPIRSVPARAGSDRKTIMAVDPSSYAAAAITAPRIVEGSGLEALRTQRAAVVVAQEVAKDYAVRPGDTLPVTVYPDDRDLSQNLNLRVVGVFRAFPPTDPLSEMVITTGSIPGPVAPPDFFLGRVADGQRADRVAAVVRQRVGTGTFAVTTITGRVQVQQRSLTALNLDGLSRIEAGAAALVAAVGVGVLGAFLVLERRREFAVLRAVGATRRDILVGPTVEGAAVTLGSLAVGIPLGLGLGVLAVRVLPLFFTLPPPLVAVPGVGTLALAGLVLVLSAGALAMALASVTRPGAEEVLREP
jgi:putative ABC transport system permease protein